ATDEGRFGNRPVLRDDLVVDDVLSALRLLKHTQVHTTGYASWTDSRWLSAGTSYRVLRSGRMGGSVNCRQVKSRRFYSSGTCLKKERRVSASVSTALTSLSTADSSPTESLIWLLQRSRCFWAMRGDRIGENCVSAARYAQQSSSNTPTTMSVIFFA